MKEEKFKFPDREAYLKAMDSILPEDFEQQRKLGGGKVHIYYPVAIKEAVADDIFHCWNVVSEEYQLIANELIAKVKLIYTPGYNGAEEQFCTGSAAIPVQMDSGSKVTDFPAKKKINALEYNMPAVRSEAIGVALTSLGNIFGRNLSRKVNKDQVLPKDFKIRS